MGASLAQLYRAGKNAEAEALERHLHARREALNDHPLAHALDGVDDGSMAATMQGSIRVKVTDFKNGHKEVCVWRHLPDPQGSLERAIERDLTGDLASREESDREANTRRAVRRAKQAVRHKCKAIRVNSLWTLTYRENVTDRDLVLKHFDRFRRKVERLLPEWRYIAVLECQQRGAWHVHLATHALPSRLERGGVLVKSWDVMRAIWRSVVGELGGNFDESKAANSRYRKGTDGDKRQRMRAGAIASYIAGYVAKEMQESERHRKRYSASTGIDLPRPELYEWPADTPLRELLECAYAALGQRITRAWFDPESCVFFAESDDSEPVG